MSTIERAAARLGSIVKRDRDASRDREKDRERLEPEFRAVDPAAAEANPTLNETRKSDVAPIESLSNGDGARASNGRRCARVELDLPALTARGFITPANSETELATDFRRIKRPLLLAIKKVEASDGRENPANLIVVTSSLPGEGKTFTSLNLAFSIAAEMDRSVLLVDGDVAKSAVAEVLGVTPEIGLTDVLNRGGGGIDDAVMATNVPGLELLSSGPRLPNTDELFASEMMRRVMRQLADRDPRRLVLVDAPPLLARTEAPNVARLASQVVVVVEADKTPQASVTEALSLLQGCENVSLILNKVTRRASDRYTYGYGYGYGARGN